MQEQYELFTATKRVHAVFLHETDEWETPQQLFDMLDREFGFTLDACATKDNAKCETYFTKETDGLSADWGTNTVWANPPYSQLNDWLQKALQASLAGATVVCLTFARTDTTAFHDAVSHASEIRFLRGRLRCSNAKNSAPAPSCLIIFRPTTTTTPQPVQLSFGFSPATGITVATMEAR